MRKWYLYEHAVCAPERDGKPQRGIIAAHLATYAGDDPACRLIATPIANAHAEGGFVLACSRCLAISEVPSPAHVGGTP